MTGTDVRTGSCRYLLNQQTLINAKYFGGGYQGPEGTDRLWKEVFDYIANAYDEDSIEHIYVNGDGADWIKYGAKVHSLSLIHI